MAPQYNKAKSQIHDNVALGNDALYSNTTGNYNVALGFNVQSGDYSGSVMLGASAAATANGQLALGSSTYPLGPVVSEVSASSTHTFAINLNGNTYRLLMIAGEEEPGEIGGGEEGGE